MMLKKRVFIYAFSATSFPAMAGTYQIYYDATARSIYNTSTSTPSIDATYYKNIIVSYETRFVGAGLGYNGANVKTYCNGTEYGNGTNVISVTTGWSAGSASMATWMPSCSLKPIVFKWEGNGWWNFGGPNQIQKITVTGVKDPPTATAQSISVNKDSNTGEVALDVDDPQGAPMAVTVVSGPSHGSLSWNGLKFTYTPTTCYEGSDSFQYYVKETIQNQTSSTVTVSITVNHVNYPPSLNTISNVRTPWYVPLNVPLSGIAKGTCGGVVTITATSSNTAVIPHPSVSYTNPNTIGALTITPKNSVTNQTGSSTVTVNISDGVNTASKTFTTTVDWVNLFHK